MASKASLALALFAAALVSVVLAGPEPLHDIYNTTYPASYFLLMNSTSPRLVESAGSLTVSDVTIIPGIQGLGVSFTKVSIAVNGYVTPHYHPRGSETFYIVSGTGNVSFVASDSYFLSIKVRTNALVAADVTVAPRGTLHWITNTGNVPLVYFSGLDAVDAGAVFLNQVYPAMPTSELAADFGVKMAVAKKLQSANNELLMFSK